MSEHSLLRDELAAQCRRLAAAGLSPGASGNVSLLVERHVLVSPSGSSLARVAPEDFVEVALDGTVVSRGAGQDPPSKEVVFHLAVYRARPSAKAVVHLHSAHAAALSVLLADTTGTTLPPHTLYHPMRLGEVAVVPALRPGSAELAEAVGVLAERHHALLLARHGLVVAGTSLVHAVELAEELEAAAQVDLLVRSAR